MRACRSFAAGITIATLLLAGVTSASAQHAAFRIRGSVRTETSEPVANAEVRVEAFYGYFAGAFGGGQRTFTATTNAKGDWNVGGLQPGIWLFEVFAPGFVPETVILPIRILTTVSMGTSGLSLEWPLVLKPMRADDDEYGQFLLDSTEAARAGHGDAVRASLQQLPADSDAGALAGAARVAIVARDFHLARTLFVRALRRDVMSYRAALGVASTLLYDRDFDNASRAFDAARSRTRDKEEQRFLSAAIGDLATIKVR